MQAVDRFTRGLPIIVLDDDDREDEADVVIAAQDITEDVMTFMINHGTGIVCCPMLPERAIELDLHLMVVKNTDQHQTAFTVSVDHEDTSTGVSSHDRTQTAKHLASDDSGPASFRRPGHMFPLVARPGLLTDRRGHTEASVALCVITEKKPVAVITELMDGAGKMLNAKTIREFSEKYDMPIITVGQISELMKPRIVPQPSPLRISETQLPTTISGREEVLTIRVFENVLTKNSYAVVFKTLDRTVRIHSVCLTGDVFHSLRCDCNQQLVRSIEYIVTNGGVIVYCMNHEGRGIGLRNKIRAYELMATRGIDTYAANIELGFKEDERDYSDMGYILRNMFGETGQLTLLSGNPKKVEMIKSFGYDVVSKVLPIFKFSHNAKYLNDKASLGGHIFDFKKNTKVPRLDKTNIIRTALVVRTDGWNKELMDLYHNNVMSVIGPDVLTKTVVCTGTMELPQLVMNEDLLSYDIVVALGIIMQGVTDHHVVVAVTSAVGLQSVSLAKNCHVVNGIVLAKTEGEILERISIEKCTILLNS